jgi:hypothetical protein
MCGFQMCGCANFKCADEEVLMAAKPGALWISTPIATR